MLETLLPVALTHWPLLAMAAVLWALGQMGKAVAPPAEASAAWKLYRQTLPFHSVIAGCVIGACFPVLAPFTAARPLSALYFAASGVLGSYGHDIYQTWRKYRGGES